MTVATQQHDGGYVERTRGGGSTGLADVVELILDKGLVVDVFARVSLVGIEILTVDARIVVASVDTYLRFAEATNRLDLYAKGKGGKDLPELAESLTEGGSRGKTSGMLDAAADKVGDLLSKGDQPEPDPAPRRRPRQGSRARSE
ncbi:MAG: gas vesicle structural protein GvpA [Pseudonocardia sp.]|nr:gas vesicle structural protein GvpA [Pseudonocardia sp.]